MPSKLDLSRLLISTKPTRASRIPTNPARLVGKAKSSHPAAWAKERSKWAEEIWPNKPLPQVTRQIVRHSRFQLIFKDFTRLYGGEPRRIRRAMARSRSKLDFRISRGLPAVLQKRKP